MRVYMSHMYLSFQVVPHNPEIYNNFQMNCGQSLNNLSNKYQKQEISKTEPQQKLYFFLYKIFALLGDLDSNQDNILQRDVSYH